jgi:hypothetical protein
MQRKGQTGTIVPAIVPAIVPEGENALTDGLLYPIIEPSSGSSSVGRASAFQASDPV